MLVKYIIKVFLYLILAVMTLIRWLLKIPMMLGNILLYFLSIIFILTGVLSYGFAVVDLINYQNTDLLACL